MAEITSPSVLKSARHWVVHRKKEPYGINGSKTGWTLSENWFTYDEAKEKFNSGGWDGLGFIVARESGRKNDQIIGGDLDCCRDPVTGEGSAWALEILKKLNTSSAVSLSGCGYRFFCLGKLPDGLNLVEGHGPDDLSDEMKEHILAAKPEARAKLEKYGPSGVWNGFELYEDGPKHLTITGQWLPEYPAELQSRNEELLEVISPFQKTPEVKVTKKTPGSRLPPLSILDVIDTSNFSREGDELVGPHPVIGSTHAKGNFKVNPGKNTWCSFHNDVRKGGDAWVYLACECGAVAWEDAGEGVLDDPAVMRKTLEHAVRRGLVSADVLGPKIKLFSKTDLSDRINADPINALNDHKVLNEIARMKDQNPIQYDAFIKEIADAHKKKGIRADTIRAQVERHKAEGDKRPDVTDDIRNEAKKIIEGGRAYEYIYEVWQKRVNGNKYLGKALLVSRGVQSCLNTKGVHVYSHGKHGHGKSLGMEKMAELLPPEFIMDEDVTPLAIHYASKEGKLLSAATLYIDEMLWNDLLAGIIKKIITKFQKGAGHRTVIDGESILTRTQPRLAIWTNSADLQADEQLRDRFLGEPIDEGCVKDIIEFQKIRDTLPEVSQDVEHESMICQEIFRDLANKTFTVKIPFATRIEIEETEGTRGYDIFSDLIKGLAALRYTKRETNERGELLATEDDFKDAKDIYEGSKGHSEESYTTAEAKVLRAIIEHGYKALYKDIKEITGLSEGRIKDIVNGRGKDEQKRHGLRYKCPKLDVSTVDISVVTEGYDRKTTHPVELSLPQSFSVWSGLNKNLVSLKPEPDRRSRRNTDGDPDVDEIDRRKDRDVVEVVNDDIRGYILRHRGVYHPSILKTKNATSLRRYVKCYRKMLRRDLLCHTSATSRCRVMR